MTPEEQAVAMVADPAWTWSDGPTRAVVHATVSAATAFENGHMDQARFWTHTACVLIKTADSPHVQRGAVLKGLVEAFGEP